MKATTATMEEKLNIEKSPKKTTVPINDEKAVKPVIIKQVAKKETQAPATEIKLIEKAKTAKAPKAPKTPKTPKTETASKAVKKKSRSPSKTIETLEDAKNSLSIEFRLKYATKYGQSLFMIGNHPLLGNNQIDKAHPLTYIDNQSWGTTLSFSNNDLPNEDIGYNYLLKNQDGTISYDWGSDKSFNPSNFKDKNVHILDAWNYAGYIENAFFTEPFQSVLLKNNQTTIKLINPKIITHVFRAKAPLLSKGQSLCIAGSSASLGKWSEENVVLMNREESKNYFETSLNLSNDIFPIEYKYGIYDVESKKLVQYESGENRLLQVDSNSNLFTIVNDGFAVLPTNNWKGAGVAIPVFSLRSENSFGVGEFSDIPKLVEWCKKTGIKLIQILPINDTVATNTYLDSYPYSSISAFALHPLYLNLNDVANTPKSKTIVLELEVERVKLNQLEAVDYEEVMRTKWSVIRKLFTIQKKATFSSSDYQQFFNQNKHWLVPYSCFCYLRDTNGTAEFENWPSYQLYREAEMGTLLDEAGEAFKEVSLHYFIQYHLHLQLKAATDYAHKNNVIVKGDIAIGISRYGADAWQHPSLYHMNLQAGAPPDDFAIKGQNWGFPTYNWQKMTEDGFAWWKQRFEQMRYYFDAFRIDHILGFFRIWSIPMHAVEGIMGHFVPAVPILVNEFNEKGIWFNLERYTKPFINDMVLWQIFGYDNELVKKEFLLSNNDGTYLLKEAFNTQRKVEKFLATWKDDDFTKKIKQGVFDLISNVILFEVNGSNGQQFHFRFGINQTSSYKNLDEHTRWQLDELYVNYFFRRQDNFWRHEAMEKLPAIKRVTNMLVCGEDLGLVPDCVPDVMKQLGILSLEIQRMPKDSTKKFFHPNDAPYLSVVTPSTHDMSTIRGWWEEDKAGIQQFYNHQLGQWGTAPFYCEAWINKAIVLQHLYSPAMWSIFQLQDILGINETIRRENPNDERINLPSNPKNYWQYRMHLTLESLLNSDEFNEELLGLLIESKRGEA